MPFPNTSQFRPIDQQPGQPEAENGIYLRDVPPGTMIEVATENSVYTIVSRNSGEAWISGHPVYCPEPVLVNIHGSIGSGGELREHYIGRGMHLEFGQEYCQAVTTSRILDVHQKPAE